MDQIIHLAGAKQVPPCTVVIFGASGDLAMRKLIPALYSLDACDDHMLADETMILGCARRPIPIDQFRQHAREAIKRYSEAEVSDACWDRFAARLDYLSGIDHPDSFARLKARLEQNRVVRGIAAQPNLLSGDSPRRDYRLGPAAARSRLDFAARYARLQPGRGGEADWRGLARARWRSTRFAQVSGRKPDLPHRPLPGQGDGPQLDGSALRQQYLRAGLEQPSHRPRAGNRIRGRRCWVARRLLRSRRALCATWFRTISFSSSP